MAPRIERLPKKKLIGKRMPMSFSNDKTFELWRSFMPRRNEIQDATGADFYSIDVHIPSCWNKFTPDAKFEKWAAREVTEFNAVPDGMETITLSEGLYAVFIHKGPASDGPRTYAYIFKTWLPNSDFSLDNRPLLH